ncbi:MAG TPA: PDZ domain-containing protein [Verrucomicrobiae bacterium]|nr:PDZ domain-containing protein [Verrucomicrobiae bacterium]
MKLFAIAASLLLAAVFSKDAPAQSVGSGLPKLSQTGQPSGSIGIVFQVPNQPSTDAAGSLVVASVIGGGPADKAGVKQGDMIESIDGTALAKAADLQNALTALTIGSTVKLGYLRQGQHLETLVTVVDRNKLYADWFEMRAGKGDADAQFNLASMYYLGQGKPQDSTLAYQWYTKAAEQDFANAQAALGYLYSTGKGVQPDYVRAAQWYRKAAEHGNALAQDNLGMMYKKGTGVPQDDKQAAQWCTKAAEQGFVQGQFHLAFMYYEGRGEFKDYSEAVKWYTKAAEKGFAPAQFSLGGMYENANGVPRDFAQALQWYSKAAEQGYAPAQLYLGSMYTDGRGVPKNLQLARQWYSKAAQDGNPEATTALAKLDASEALTAAQNDKAKEDAKLAARAAEAAEAQARETDKAELHAFDQERASFLADLNRNATRPRCKSYLTDTDSFNRQLHYLRYSQLSELYARIGQQCPVLFQGSTVEDARAREILGENGLPTVIFAQIESRVIGYLQAQDLMRSFLLSPFADRDRAANKFYVQDAVEWIRKTNRLDQFTAFDAKSVDEALAWRAATPEREKQVRQKAREAEEARKRQEESDKQAHAKLWLAAQQQAIDYLSSEKAIDDCVDHEIRRTWGMSGRSRFEFVESCKESLAQTLKRVQTSNIETNPYLPGTSCWYSRDASQVSATNCSDGEQDHVQRISSQQ